MRAFRLQSLRGLRQVQSRLPRQSSWSCPGFRVYQVQTCRCNSSDSSSALADQAKEKPYYVTTPIFYVNAAPHIGHLYTMILADVLKRWQQVKGKEAFLCTGTDEHGMKIQQAAAKEGVPPKDFCDDNASKFKDLAGLAHISNDFFIRTTDEEHKRVVEQFWLLLKTRAPEGLGLYKGKHEGWYCVSDECFYPEDLVQPSVVPQTGRKMMASVETGNEVEWVSEDTWFFPLSKYKEKLLRFYDENPDWIQPAHRMNEVRDWVENHLEDLSITRPASRLSWGIKDPEDSSNTIYVWVDALINYVTTAGFGTKWHTESADKGIWPADVHVVGKDIIRFHAIYWPALLMAVGLPLPKKIVCHNHWTMSNRKMSKSLGNVVNPFFAAQRWDIDPLRYFLMRNGSFKGDMSYSNDVIIVTYEKELQANMGNLFNRISLNKRGTWSTLEAVESAQKGELDNLSETVSQEHPEAFLSHEKALQEAPELIRNNMDDINISGALREVFELLRQTNRLISDTAPWRLAKETSPEARLRLNWVIYRSAEALRIASILLQPIMPNKAAALLNGLGVKPERRTAEFAVRGADLEYGMPPPSKPAGQAKPTAWDSLFPPVAGIELEDFDVVSGGLVPETKGKKRISIEFQNAMPKADLSLAAPNELGPTVVGQFEPLALQEARKLNVRRDFLDNLPAIDPKKRSPPLPTPSHRGEKKTRLLCTGYHSQVATIRIYPILVIFYDHGKPSTPIQVARYRVASPRLLPGPLETRYGTYLLPKSMRDCINPIIKRSEDILNRLGITEDDTDIDIAHREKAHNTSVITLFIITNWHQDSHEVWTLAVKEMVDVLVEYNKTWYVEMIAPERLKANCIGHVPDLPGLTQAWPTLQSEIHRRLDTYQATRSLVTAISLFSLGFSPDPALNPTTVYISLDDRSDETQWDAISKHLESYLHAKGWTGFAVHMEHNVVEQFAFDLNLPLGSKNLTQWEAAANNHFIQGEYQFMANLGASIGASNYLTASDGSLANPCAGTLGCYIEIKIKDSKEWQKFGLTNYHVVRPCLPGFVLDVRTADPATTPLPDATPAQREEDAKARIEGRPVKGSTLELADKNFRRSHFPNEDMTLESPARVKHNFTIWTLNRDIKALERRVGSTSEQWKRRLEEKKARKISFFDEKRHIFATVRLGSGMLRRTSGGGRLDWAVLEVEPSRVGQNLLPLWEEWIASFDPARIPDDDTLGALLKAPSESLKNMANGTRVWKLGAGGLTSGTVGRYLTKCKIREDNYLGGHLEYSNEYTVFGGWRGAFAGPGDSGSVVFNARGEAVGLVSSGQRPGAGAPSGFSFVTPIEDVLEDIKASSEGLIEDIRIATV
ncbi:hypothetical protein FDECE_982 [Fusarium decemcellulare]|nr:hypothetical protein FDECE_982 [Fusarium decemcellulare]